MKEKLLSIITRCTMINSINYLNIFKEHQKLKKLLLFQEISFHLDKNFNSLYCKSF